MLCAIAIIDSDASERLVNLEQIAERFGIHPQNVHGHITLATYIGDDEERFISSCKSILSGYGAFSVFYDKVELWAATSGVRSVLVAITRKENAVAAIQKEISKGWSAYLNEWTQEDIWRPHTTLLYVPGTNLDVVAEAMREEFEPFTAQVGRIEFSRVYENGYEIIDFTELQKKKSKGNQSVADKEKGGE